ncbi:MAG: hypothetical protein LBJ64_02520 [Deltaproteobacteria bacterium]|nr:hypothetical protein [Deltaproteobacteria bacterium]
MKFANKKKSRRPVWFIVLILLAAIGYFGYDYWKKGSVEIPNPIAVISETVSSLAEEPPPPSPAPTVSAGAAFPPPVQEASVGESSVRKILDRVLTSWVAALVKEDFSEFHQILSYSWQLKDSPAQLLTSFSALLPFKENLMLFPSRGKLVLLESRQYTVEGLNVAEGVSYIRDNVGPESPWMVRGEWRVNKTALGFTLVLNLEDGQWRPSGLGVEIFN